MLNGKPTYSHQPIYQPGKKKKKIQKKLLYLISAIVLVIIILVVVLINIKKPEDVHRGFSIEEVILQEVELNSLLREEVLSTNGVVWWEDIDFPPQTKEKIQSMTPYFIDCVTKICESDDSCSLMNQEIEELKLESKKIYSDSVLILSDSDDKAKVVRIFCWGIDEELDGVIDEGSDGVDEDGEKCVLETNQEFCLRYGKNCGSFSDLDNCGNQRTVNCESCIAPETCGGGGLSNVCGEEVCVLETNQEFCLRYGRNCGSFSDLDNCGNQRTVNCGSCIAPETCGGGGLSNVCGEEVCVLETNQEFCLRYGRNCGSFSDLDNCGNQRTVNCGSCIAPETCGGGGLSNVCGEEVCVLETNQEFCLRYGKNCGVFLGTDNCEQTRTVNCGSCTAPETCGGSGLANVCGEEVCVLETNQEFCLRYGKNCGSFSDLDNCGNQRTANCGICTAPETCVDNACVETCQPNCTGKCGGSDGCGATCPNTCTGKLVCKAPNYKSCGPEGSVEFLGRSLIALPKNNGIYLGWRLLPWDNKNIGFNVYRATSASGPFTKINSAPIKTSTNYHDQNVASGTYYYMVRTVDSSGIEGVDSNLAKVKTSASKDYISIPLRNRAYSDNANDVAERLPADLNGNGVMDFVLQLGYIHEDKSDAQICQDTTLRIEAIMSNSDGTWSSAWKVDTGFKDCVKGGGFLSAWDLTGDGKAEIITRWGSGGNLAVLSGSDGSLIAVKPWPHWWKTHTYLAIALLEDVTGDGIADPFIVIQSGGYGTSIGALFTAYRLEGKNLVEKRRLDIALIRKQTLQEDEDGKKYWGNSTHPAVWGMGTHGLVAVDLTGDGFDEVVPCGSIFYPDWSGYWVVSSGHCDGCFPGDLNPSNPGAEVFMACSKPQEATLVRLTPGQEPQRFWTFKSYTCSPHHCGFHKAWCGDISVSGYSGMACLGRELDGTVSGDGNNRVFTIPGLEITNKYNWPSKMYTRWPIDWNKGDQTNKILYPVTYKTIADVVGDSREENVVYDKKTNTLRIFTNTNVLNSRYVTPLADRGYRSGVARQGNGYPTVRILVKTNQPRLDIVPGL